MTNGRRLPDTRFGKLPDDARAGDYWKYLDETGAAMRADSPSNLTDTVWGYYSPNGDGIGTLRLHTVREETDGTISIRPGDGSSNSVLHSGGGAGKTWHGYVEHGVWREC